MEDKDIVKLFLERDEKAIGYAEQKYGTYCRSISRSIVGTNEDANECLNDTFLRAWNSIPPAKPENLKAYLAKIIRNLSLDLYDSKNAQKRGNGEMPVIYDELSECIASEESVIEKLEASALTTAINDFLSKQKPELRKLFVKRYWYAQSVKEIAQSENASESYVKMSLHRLRKKLSDFLSKESWL